MSATHDKETKRSWLRLLMRLAMAAVLAGILLVGFVVRMDPRPYAYESTLKADLRILAGAQAEHFEEHETYAKDLEALEFVRSDGVTVRLHTVDSGWSATSEIHGGDFPFSFSVECLIVVGDVQPAAWSTVDATGLQDGQIACRRD